MKPTPELIEQWLQQAIDIDEDDELHQAHIIAELAAQWGAEQAKSSPPSVEHCLWARNGHTPCQHTQQREPVGHCPQAQQIAEPELPEAAAWHYRSSGEDRYAKKLTTPGMHQTESKPLFTATQMHDHFQAGVRAGMGQSQDARRYQWLKGAGRCMAVDTFGGRYRVADMSCNLVVTDWLNSFDAAIDAAMQGGQK